MIKITFCERVNIALEDNQGVNREEQWAGQVAIGKVCHLKIDDIYSTAV